MKRLLKLTFALVVACSLFACGEKKWTEKDCLKAEKALFAEETNPNMDVLTHAVDVYCQFVEENPEAPTAAEWLFKALQISAKNLPAEKSIEIGNKLMADYPDFEQTPVAMFLMGSMVYEEKLGNYGKALEMYETLLERYPDSDFAESARYSIRNIGKSPEDLVREFEMMADSIPME